MAHQLKCLACTSINGVDIVQVHVDHDTPDFPLNKPLNTRLLHYGEMDMNQRPKRTRDNTTCRAVRRR